VSLSKRPLWEGFPYSILSARLSQALVCLLAHRTAVDPLCTARALGPASKLACLSFGTQRTSWVGTGLWGELKVYRVVTPAQASVCLFLFDRMTVWLSTAPTEPLTHWYQVRCLFQSPLFAKAGDTLSGTCLLIANKR
jgi:hypothetical protein